MSSNMRSLLVSVNVRRIVLGAVGDNRCLKILFWKCLRVLSVFFVFRVFLMSVVRVLWFTVSLSGVFCVNKEEIFYHVVSVCQ